MLTQVPKLVPSATGTRGLLARQRHDIDPPAVLVELDRPLDE
jgi:hypothetical protein